MRLPDERRAYTSRLLGTNHHRIHSLRKGQANVYFLHPQTGHSIEADHYECELAGDKAVLRFSLNPVDENQRVDEVYSLSHDLVSISLDDTLVID